MRLPSLIACLIMCLPIGVYGQSASDISESRLSCAEGAAQRVVERARAMGIQMGSAELCVKALNWTANNGDLLDLYARRTGQGNARLFINRATDSAKLSADPFRPSGSALDMWNRGELTPSLAFDAGFTRSYLEKRAMRPGTLNAADLKHKTEGCLNQTQSLAVCVETGQVQGTLAYQMNSAFSDSNAKTAPSQESQEPNRAQVQAAIDQKFQNWSRSWSWDRYRPGSVQITSTSCSDQCKASGEFSFLRMGMLHTIPFVAFLPKSTDGYSLGRLCYNDETTKQLDCTD